MTISFDRALGIHEAALSIRAQRAEVIANNLANSDTPGFKARDIDFSQALEQVQSSQFSNTKLEKTHFKHLDSAIGQDIPGLLYRNPLQPDTGDGNTVDAQVEQAKFTENSLQYQTTLRFLDGKFKGLILALKGE